jgi:anti-sigma B factor antagonist
VRISVRFNDDVAMMTLDGKFIAGSDGPFLRQKVKDLIDAGVKKLFLDFTGVPYIDSTGLGFLAGSRATAEKASVRMVLGGVNPHVMKILDDVKLSQFFTFAADEKTGVENLKKDDSTSGPANASKAKKRSSAPAD